MSAAVIDPAVAFNLLPLAAVSAMSVRALKQIVRRACGGTDVDFPTQAADLMRVDRSQLQRQLDQGTFPLARILEPDLPNETVEAVLVNAAAHRGIHLYTERQVASLLRLADVRPEPQSMRPEYRGEKVSA